VARAELTAGPPHPVLDAVERSAEEALARAGADDRYIGVASFTVRLRFAGPALVAHVLPAVAHQSVAPVPDPALTISVWDSESTDAPQPGDGGSLSLLDAERDRGWLWTDGAIHVDRAAPLTPIIRPWLADRGIELVHAAGVGSPRRCALLAGGRGAGKSNLVIACLKAGLRCLGDDTCLIGSERPPTLHSLYRSVQADPDTLEAAPSLEPSSLAPRPGGKAVGFLEEGAILPAAPLRAVAIAQIAAGPGSRLRPASPAEALAAIAPTTILRMPGPGQTTLTRLAGVLEGTPCHRLEFGSDRDGAAEVVRGLL
jgi:hypothetical protein